MKTFDEIVREAQLARKEKRDQLVKEVVALWYEGYSASEIGWELALSESAVRAMLRRGGVCN